jgi:hypothetical protein
MLRIEMAEIGFSVCDRRGDIRGMTFDEEMEVSGTVELELERRLTRLQKAAVPFTHLDTTRVNGSKRLEQHDVLKRRIYVAGFQRSNNPMQIQEEAPRLLRNTDACFLGESKNRR